MTWISKFSDPSVKIIFQKAKVEPAKKTKKAPPKKVVEEPSSEEESDDSESGEEVAPASPVKKTAKKPAKMEVDDDSEDDSGMCQCKSGEILTGAITNQSLPWQCWRYHSHFSHLLTSNPAG
jgi:hypothetical protein